MSKARRPAGTKCEPELLEICKMLKWDWRKKPANPEIRAEMATELRDARAFIFARVVASERRKALRKLCRAHQRIRLKLQPLLRAENTIRSMSGRMLADYCLWLHGKLII